MRVRGTRAVVLVACVAALAFAVGPVGAGPAARIGLGAGSALWIKGTSNVHDFEARTSDVTIRLLPDSSQHAPVTPAQLDSLVRASGVRGLDVEVRTESLRSGKSGLDKNMWQDLRAAAFPTIQYHLTRYVVSRGTGDTLAVRAEGVLQIGGRERPVTLMVRGYRGDAGLWFEGAQALRMTDFGIKPRTMMLGTLRVRDDITVGFRLLLTTTAH